MLQNKNSKCKSWHNVSNSNKHCYLNLVLFKAYMYSTIMTVHKASKVLADFLINLFLSSDTLKMVGFYEKSFYCISFHKLLILDLDNCLLPFSVVQTGGPFLHQVCWKKSIFLQLLNILRPSFFITADHIIRSIFFSLLIPLLCSLKCFLVQL